MPSASPAQEPKWAYCVSCDYICHVGSWTGKCPECGTREMYREYGYVCDECGTHYSVQGDAEECTRCL